MSLQVFSIQLMKNFKCQWRNVTSHSYQEPSHPYCAVDNIIHATRLSKIFELGLHLRAVFLQKNFRCPNLLPFSGSVNKKGFWIKTVKNSEFSSLFWILYLNNKVEQYHGGAIASDSQRPPLDLWQLLGVIKTINNIQLVDLISSMFTLLSS